MPGPGRAFPDADAAWAAWLRMHRDYPPGIPGRDRIRQQIVAAAALLPPGQRDRLPATLLLAVVDYRHRHLIPGDDPRSLAPTGAD